LRDGLVGCRIWFHPLDLLVGAALGLAAWLITSLAFVYLVRHLGLPVPFPDALAIYPLAMLVGAASMLPGGFGSTEATIAAMLTLYGVALPLAVLAAVGIRLATIWFAIVCGLAAAIRLEALLLRR
ncbi:MAG: lysylphosphatidylglycerol synthase domain-containing protein, partial [Steroidobacteraceae bacterium]